MLCGKAWCSTDRGIFLSNIYEMCFEYFWIGRGEKGEKTHTKKDIQLKTLVEKLTLVIWAPKLEGFAFNTSAENVTSQRKKKVKIKQEWKRKKK